MPYLNAVRDILSLIILFLGVFVIIEAEGITRWAVAAVLIALLFVPDRGFGQALSWVWYIGKVAFGIGCYIYLKVHDFWIFGR